MIKFDHIKKPLIHWIYWNDWCFSQETRLFIAATKFHNPLSMNWWLFVRNKQTIHFFSYFFFLIQCISELWISASRFLEFRRWKYSRFGFIHLDHVLRYSASKLPFEKIGKRTLRKIFSQALNNLIKSNKQTHGFKLIREKIYI